MIEYKRGDLLEVTSGMIAHGCNYQGVMGSGVAKLVRRKYPEVYDKYSRYVQVLKSNGIVPLGFVHEVKVSDDLRVANCFTQEYYGTDKRQVSYDAIANCFSIMSANESVRNEHGRSYNLNIPLIGAGLAGGDWDVIKEIIKSEYKHDVTVWVYE